jgi:hypothetical protein
MIFVPTVPFSSTLKDNFFYENNVLYDITSL